MIIVTSHKSLCVLQNQGCKSHFKISLESYICISLTTTVLTNLCSMFAKRRKINSVEQTAMIENEKESTSSSEAVKSATNTPNQPESSAGTENAKFSHWDICRFVGFKICNAQKHNFLTCWWEPERNRLFPSITVFPTVTTSYATFLFIGRLHARDQTSSKCAFEKSG